MEIRFLKKPIALIYQGDHVSIDLITTKQWARDRLAAYMRGFGLKQRRNEPRTVEANASQSAGSCEALASNSSSLACSDRSSSVRRTYSKIYFVLSVLIAYGSTSRPTQPGFACSRKPPAMTPSSSRRCAGGSWPKGAAHSRTPLVPLAGKCKLNRRSTRKENEQPQLHTNGAMLIKITYTSIVRKKALPATFH